MKSIIFKPWCYLSNIYISKMHVSYSVGCKLFKAQIHSKQTYIFSLHLPVIHYDIYKIWSYIIHMNAHCSWHLITANSCRMCPWISESTWTEGEWAEKKETQCNCCTYTCSCSCSCTCCFSSLSFSLSGNFVSTLSSLPLQFWTMKLNGCGRLLGGGEFVLDQDWSVCSDLFFILYLVTSFFELACTLSPWMVILTTDRSIKSNNKHDTSTLKTIHWQHNNNVLFHNIL